jgi:hypothetical protein
MQGLAQVAQRLREVREAHERFLALYAVEVALVEPGMHRVSADVSAGTDDGNPDAPHWFQSDANRDGPASFGWQ